MNFYDFITDLIGVIAIVAILWIGLLIVHGMGF